MQLDLKKNNLIVDKSFEFSLLIISLYQKLIGEKEYILSKQLLRSGTSIGANINEATAGCSKKDFIHKLTISHKEAFETQYWLKLLDQSNLTKINVDIHLEEIERLIKILTSIIITARKNLNKQ